MTGTYHLASAPFGRRERLAIPDKQILLLCLVIGFGAALVLSTMQEAPYSTVLLLVTVSVVGVILCRKAAVDLHDTRLRVLGYFWLAKIALTLTILYVGWIPQLDRATSPAWGYDPQRYYVQAQQLLLNNWIPDFLSLNYVGILYYYGAIYYLLGQNPVIPALVNAFVTLLSTLYLVRIAYAVEKERRASDWSLAIVLLLPEMLWYDVMTSRETLMAALLIFGLLTAGRYVAFARSISAFKALSIIAFSAVGIAAVRTSMLLPLVASTALFVLVVRARPKPLVWNKTVLLATALGALAIGLGVSQIVGGYGLDLGRVLRASTSARDNIALSADVTWSANSTGMLLMPEGVLESILFVPPRMLLYLVAPLPKVTISISALFQGSWSAWQYFMTYPSAVINLLAMPYVIAGSVQAIRSRRIESGPLILIISYWATFAGITAGNLVIHERYRVMAAPLLWACAWLGWRRSSKALLEKSRFLWFGLIALGGLAYVLRKGLL